MEANIFKSPRKHTKPEFRNKKFEHRPNLFVLCKATVTERNFPKLFLESTDHYDLVESTYNQLDLDRLEKRLKTV